MTDSRIKQQAARLTQREQFCLCSLYCHNLQQIPHGGICWIWYLGHPQKCRVSPTIDQNYRKL